MKHYRHILFDLDHTLWDFQRNAHETLHELYAAHRLADIGFSARQLCEAFEAVNFRLWDLYNQGGYDWQRLRSERFGMVFTQLGVAADLVPATLAEEYLSSCPAKPHVMPHTVAVLDYLHQHYQLHILTNGFAEVQAIKLASAQLTHYFATVVCSDTTGHRKPHRPIFDYLLAELNADQSECLMIGDNLKTDILGAKNASIDQVYYNPHRVEHPEQPTYEITCLSDLVRIL